MCGEEHSRQKGRCEGPGAGACLRSSKENETESCEQGREEPEARPGGSRAQAPSALPAAHSAGLGFASERSGDPWRAEQRCRVALVSQDQTRRCQGSLACGAEAERGEQREHEWLEAPGAGPSVWQWEDEGVPFRVQFEGRAGRICRKISCGDFGQ